MRWHDALKHDAPSLTIDSALRLLRDDGELEWKPCVDGARERRSDSSASTSRAGRRVDGGAPAAIRVDWASGAAWGRDSFLLRVAGCVADASVADVLTVLRDRRPEWDHLCVDVEPVETGESGGCSWDVARHRSRAPKGAKLLRCLFLCAWSRSVARLTLLRAWRTDVDRPRGNRRDRP